MKNYITISFDLQDLGHDGLKTLFEIEQKLLDLGISFDTGAGFGQRDWEWDWSLKGPVKFTIRKKEEQPLEEKDNND